MATLQLNTHLISNKEDLTKLIDFLDNDPSALVTGLDLETTVTETVFDKHIRTIQIGNRDIQFCIDLKHFANGDIANQGFLKTPEWAIPIKDALEKRYFCNPKYLKVGHYLQFECMMLKWCLGIDVYGLYCTYLVEQILNAGKVRFTESGFYGLDDIAKRRCNFVMDKTLQTSFNLTDELSSDQIYYACLDVRVPLAIRKSQLKDIDLLQVAEVVKVENDAIPAFANMHCNGFYLDWEKWQKTLSFYKEKHINNIKKLDEHFIPIVGKKSTEEELLGFKNIVDQAEAAWRNETKDKLVRAANRKHYQELNRKYKELVEFQETCEGEALINYGSNLQILEALTKIGFKIKNTDDQTLSLLEDHPIIKTLQNFRATQKILSTYGDNWQKYINPITGRVHSDFQQIGAETGRTASKNPNCFPPDVEILTENGWVYFNNLDKNTKVAQFNTLTSEISFTYPTNYTKYFIKEDLVHIKTEEQINFICTKDHECLLKNRKTNKIVKVPAIDYMEDYIQLQAGNFVGGNIDFSENQLILLCATQADAHVSKNGNIIFSFKKQRKIERLKLALDTLKIKYKFKISNNITTFKIFSSDVPDWLKNKKYFNNWVLSLTKESFNLLSEEVWFWDGCFSRRTMYSSSNKINADWVQIITALSGRRAKIRSYRNNNPNSKLNWQVDATNQNYSLTTNLCKQLIPYSGYVYCVSVPDNNIIIRYKNKITIIGNCQNIIKPEKGEPSFRACFTSLQRPGYVLLISDMSGAELRLIAELSGEPVWVDAYLKGIDVHSLGAELIYQAQWWASQEADCAYRLKGEKCKCTLHKILRDFVKAINFGIAYGMEARKLASQLKIPIEQAQVLLDNYRETFKAIIAVLKKLGDKGKTELVSRDLIGRPRFFTKPTLEMAKEKLLKDQAAKAKKNETFNVTTSRIRQKYFSMYSAIEREAKNHPFQSGNVSIAKLAAGAGYDKNGKPFLYHILKNYDARLVNFVHDEFVIEVAKEQAEELRLKVEDAINRAGKEYMKLVEMLSESKISEIWEKQ